LSCGITEAGPDDPIYKNGWTVGATRLPKYPKSGPEEKKADSQSVPQEEIDAIFQAAKEQMSGEYPSEKTEESQPDTEGI